MLIIRHDIIPQKFHPNNPSISPQLANLNVLANSKGHDLQIVGNIWIFPQELGSSFFYKIQMFSFWNSLCHFLNKQILVSESRPVLYTNRMGLCVFILWSETTHLEAIYNVYIALDVTRGVSELRPKPRPHRV